MHTQFGRSALGFRFSSEHKGKTMKKVLFATTALIATAGIAAADVAISGSAEMGVNGGDTTNTQFFTDIDVTFTLSGETDGGITFGAAVDLDEATNIGTGDTTADQDGVAIFISGDFGTLTMGDTDGALDFALTEAWVGNAGSISDAETSHVGALGSYADGLYDGQILRYDYSIADFAFAVSVEMDDSTPQRDTGYAVGATYALSFSGGSANFGIGYQTGVSGAANTVGNTGIPIAANIDVEVVGVSAAVALDNGLQAAIQYSSWDFNNGVNDAQHIGVGAGYSFDAITVSANYGMYTSDFAPLDGFTGYGVAAAYDFGGGLSAHLGYGANTDCGTVACASDNSWSFGLAMSF